MLYRPLRKDIFVQFVRGTRIYNSNVPPSMFERYVFDFIPFHLLQSRVNDHKYLTDVIGTLSQWGTIETVGASNDLSNGKLRKIVLTDGSLSKVVISLWGMLATKFNDDDIRKMSDKNIVVIVTSCKVGLFKDLPTLRSTVASQLYINLPTPMVDIHKTFPPIPVSFSSDQVQVNPTQRTRISDIYNELLHGVVEGSQYTIAATIVDIDMYNDWKFTRCSSCRKKASFVNNEYYCDVCRKAIANPLQVYKLVIEVVDGDYEMSCVLFDDYAKPLIGITVDELLTKSYCEGGNDPDWIYNLLVDMLYGRRVVLSIKADKFNLSPKFGRRFTVVKYFDVNDTMASEQTTGASTSTVPPLPTERDDYCELDYCDLESEEEKLSNITDFEWDMTAKVIWGESNGSQSPNKCISEVPCANDDAEQSVNSTIESHDD